MHNNINLLIEREQKHRSSSLSRSLIFKSNIHSNKIHWLAINLFHANSKKYEHGG